MAHTFKIINFTDLKWTWVPSEIFKTQVYSEIFWNDLYSDSLENLRNNLIFLIELTKSYGAWYKNFWINSPHRRISAIETMKKDTLIDHIQQFLNIDLQDFIKYAENRIENEKQLMDEYINNLNKLRSLIN